MLTSKSTNKNHLTISALSVFFVVSLAVLNITVMKNLLKAEEAAQLALALAALYYQPVHIEWWLWLPVFLSPDLSMLGYLFNTRAGALFYNIAHHKAIAGLAIGL